MNILSYFDRINTANHIIYRLKKGEWKNFINKLPDEFRLCYISDENLNILSLKAEITNKLYLEKYILPDEPSIKSGDFGEMLCYHAVVEHYFGKGIVLIGPRKWEWKDNRNKPAPGTDVILFHISNLNKPTKKDILVTVESKMKTVNSKKNRIQDAIDGATNDRLSRMSKTLSWLEEKYAKMGEEKKRKLIERFKDPATFGNYKKKHKAIAILDRSVETNETSKTITNVQNVFVIVFSIDDLKKAYENTRTNILNSV